MRRNGERGAAQLSSIVSLLAIVALAWAAWNVGPLYFDHYDFVDKVNEICRTPKYKARTTDEVVVDMVMKEVRERRLDEYIGEGQHQRFHHRDQPPDQHLLRAHRPRCCRAGSGPSSSTSSPISRSSSGESGPHRRGASPEAARRRQPEGWRGQDHALAEPRLRPGHAGAPHPARRHRSPGRDRPFPGPALRTVPRASRTSSQDGGPSSEMTRGHPPARAAAAAPGHPGGGRPRRLRGAHGRRGCRSRGPWSTPTGPSTWRCSTPPAASPASRAASCAGRPTLLCPDPGGAAGPAVGGSGAGDGVAAARAGARARARGLRAEHGPGAQRAFAGRWRARSGEASPRSTCSRPRCPATPPSWPPPRRACPWVFSERTRRPLAGVFDQLAAELEPRLGLQAGHGR